MERQHLRYWTTIALLAAFSAVVAVRFAGLALEGHSPASALSTAGVRGLILDRAGRPLAVDTNLYNVAVWRPELDKKAWTEHAAELDKVLGLKVGSIQAAVEQSHSDFLFAARRIPASLAREVNELKQSRKYTGFIVERIRSRLYPEGDLASHVVGFVGNDHYGLAGVESRYEKELSAGPSGRGRRVADGNHVVLTLDLDAQFLLTEIAQRAFDENGAESVILLAQRASTGEILAYVSLPDFDPNDFLSYPKSNWTDRPALYAFEPGSVFKVFSMASLMELGGIDERSAFICDGAYERVVASGETIRIRCTGIHGRVTVRDILKLSCNDGAAQASDTVSALDFYNLLREFGFGTRTGLPLPGESPGSLRVPSAWSIRSKPTIAMGQELLVTAVQMTAAAGAIANGGVLLKPRLVSRVMAPDGSIVSEEPIQPVRRVMSPENARKILESMEAAAGGAGTGRRAAIPDVRLAVKTGTAQMIDPDTGRYSERDFIASTVGIFPAEAPEIVLYLAIVKPRGESTFGGRIAAPVIREAAESLMTLYGMARGTTPVLTHPGRVVLPRPDPIKIGDTMPDLSGVPKRLLLPILAREDLELSLEGEGYVVSQDPPAGAPVPPGTRIRLVLE
ncbi:MAG TPA: penicillin-binding transpeptidase domain-containing protein [Magnetospirillaceae bacterium]|nr:penicillin-binding transpeptidase domain-containing protein [Magnetospirillaceae bacterium]